MSLREIDKHFQQFLLINKIMSNYQRKRDRSGELSQSGLKVILLRLGNFHTYIRKKGVRTKPYVSFYPVKVGCILQKKKHYPLFKEFWFGLCFHIKYRKPPWKGYSWVFHNVVLVQGAPCSSLNLVFRRKLRHDFIFGIPY